MIDLLIEEPLVGFLGKQSGMIVAFRNNGEEGLFVSRDNVPVKWIALTDFVGDPKAVLKAEDILPDDED